MAGNRGTSRAWREARAYVLARDGWECQVLTGGIRCGQPATVAGHVIPVIAGGTDDPSNLRAECALHSSREGARFRNSGRGFPGAHPVRDT